MGYCQLVVFTLGLEEYAINICHAKEIIRIPKITKIPAMPSFIEGVFNLRGKIIPVFDLKKRFGFEQSDRSTDSRLLILELEGMTLGFTVDDISEVIKIEEKSIDNLGDEIFGINKNSIQGISLVGERIIIILNALTLKSEISKYKLEKELIV
jgi:purine-binding chemotaxis protein CheW